MTVATRDAVNVLSQLPKSQGCWMWARSKSHRPIANKKHLCSWNGVCTSSVSEDRPLLSFAAPELEQMLHLICYHWHLCLIGLMTSSVGLSITKIPKSEIKCTFFSLLWLACDKLRTGLSMSAPSSKQTVTGLSTRVDTFPLGSFCGTMRDLIRSLKIMYSSSVWIDVAAAFCLSVSRR